MKVIHNLFCCILFFAGINGAFSNASKVKPHQDTPFIQEYSIKYTIDSPTVKLYHIASDRNGYVQLLSNKGLMRLYAGQFLFPGNIVKDVQDLPTSDKNINGLITWDNQLVYTDNKAVFSNAWAGKLYSIHHLAGAKIFAGGNDFEFLVSDGKKIIFLKDSKILWEKVVAEKQVTDIKFDSVNHKFFILTSETISSFSPQSKEYKTVYTGSGLKCFEVTGTHIIAGTNEGYFGLDLKSFSQTIALNKKMPWNEITSVTQIDGVLWFGSTWGAMRLNRDGKFSYYASKRWLPSDSVITIAKGPDNSVLVLTTKGVGKICRQEMTLYDKAVFYEKQVRERHIRTGFNATISRMVDGDVTTGTLENSDNDGLWTSMYLAAETFRYAVTKSPEALQNVSESLDAMERLYTINPMKSGFPSRSFQRSGYNNHDKPWRKTEDPEWDWKSTTSSDEAIGHIFAFGAIAELVDVPEIRKKAITLIDTLMSHTLNNNYYLVDWDGQPTKWGRWHPEYVNARPLNVGDRKINASNYIGMLQTAYYFTKKEKYKKAAFYLMKEHGYLTNLMRPMKEIGHAPDNADELSKELSDGWNHSDDEMYYCGYWGLYRYAFNDTLKRKYREAIIDHWQMERPEKEGLWNIMTAIAETDQIDLKEAVWYLQGYPLDMINWTVRNSHRKDIEFVGPNFRNQTIKEVLPPGELRISRHNANRFDLDEHGEGRAEHSAGDIWLLPYWIGRYLGVITAPVKK